eukprot:CAMPEP_0184542848 /NCGR_PEP_ID=MMETSP0199_2-20130426/2461_1 /TAXON_ID=1112570 /ORGANISM="Thraustochytrium sp., Strain LLF1b" /LENGTH=188 /DNA_ID=CAMNT_0026936775 /DNA_START=104 /DNA_END=671 /DNA_ORIENTATION=+
MKIVALTGLKGSGKDTFASGLELPDFVHLAIADHLKEKASQVFGVPLFHFHDRGLKDGPIPGSGTTPRDLVKLTGDAYRKVYGDKYIIQTLIECVPASVPGVVITDLRLECELEYLLERFANDVQVVHIDRGLVAEDHPTEMGVARVVERAKGQLTTITNNGDVEDLEDRHVSSESDLTTDEEEHKAQ